MSYLKNLFKKIFKKTNNSDDEKSCCDLNLVYEEEVEESNKGEERLEEKN